MIRLEFNEEGVEGTKVVGGAVRIEVKDGWQREAEEQIVCRALGKVARREIWELVQVGLAEEERVEPVHSPVVCFSEVVQCGYAL